MGVLNRHLGMERENETIALLTLACGSFLVSLYAGYRLDGIGRTVELLENSESAGVISVVGNKVRFNHPLLARGVYTDADPQLRRRVHRRLADLVAEPELRARHLALAATTADPVTLAALDQAAAAARQRPPRRPSCSSWRSGSAETPQNVEYRLPTTIFVPGTPAPR